MMNPVTKEDHLKLQQELAQTRQRLAELKLSAHENETRYASVLAAMAEGVVVHDASGTIVACNPRAEAILGLTVDQMMGRTSIDPRWGAIHEDGSLFPGDTHPAMQTLATGKPFSGIIMGVHLADGGIHWISINSRPIYWQAGEFPDAVVATFVDITERRRIERENAFQAYVLNQIQQSVIVTDKAGQFVYWNHYAEKFFQTQPQRAIELFRREIPNNKELFEQSQSIREGILRGETWTGELKLQQPGSGVQFFSAHVSALTSDHDKPAGFVGVFEDITQQKRVEQDLRESEELFSTIFRATPDPIAITRLADDTVLDINPAFEEFFGLSRGQVVGHSSHEVDIWHNQSERDESMEKALRRDQVSLETRYKTQSGEVKTMLASTRKVSIGAQDCMVILGRDITERKRAEEKNEAMLLRFRTLLNTSTDGIHILDETGQVIETNPSFDSQLGFTHDEIIRLNVADWNVDWSHDELLQKIDAIIQTPTTFETRHRRKDGSIIDVEINGVGVELQGKRYLYASARDISERKIVQKALVLSEARMRAIMESSTDAIGVHINGIWKLCNPAAVRMFGVASPDELLETPLVDVLAPGERERVTRMVQKRRQSEDAPLSYVTRGVRRDGSEFDMDVSISSFEVEGEQHVMAVLRDITERLKAEKALRESEERFSTVFWASQEAITITRLSDGMYLEANPAFCAMFGLRRDQVIGHNRTDIALWVEPEQRAAFSQLLEENSQVDGFEAIYMSMSGSIGTLLASGCLIKVSGVECLLVSAIDISAQKETEAKLRASEHQYMQFIDLLPIGVLVHSGGKILLSNHSSARLFGADSPAALEGTQVFDRVHPEYRSSAGARVDEMAVRKTSAPWIEEKLLRLDGAAFDAEVAAMQVNYLDAQATLAIFSDISERKAAETALATSEEKFRKLFEHLSQGVIQYTPDGKIVTLNPAAERILGLSRESAVGLGYFGPQWDTYKEDGSAQAPEEYPLAVALRSGRQVDNFILRVVNSALKLDILMEGSVIPVFRPANSEPYMLYSIFSDVTAHRQAEQAVRESEQFYHDLFDNNHAIKLLIDTGDGSIVRANRAAADFYGCSLEQLQAININQLSTMPQTEIDTILNNTIRGVKSEFLDEHHLANGEMRDVQVFAGLVTLRGRRLNYAIVQDITARRRAETALRNANEQLAAQIIQVRKLQDELREQSVRDALTGLYNRRYLNETIERELARAAREQVPLSVIMADIDHFKAINDTYGHQIGDQVLIEVAKIFGVCTRPSDIVCRYGGEEFLIVLPGVDIALAEQRAEEIRSMCADLRLATDPRGLLRVFLSLGVTSYPLQSTDAVELLAKADQAMYTSKRKGRNRVTRWSDDL